MSLLYALRRLGFGAKVCRTLGRTLGDIAMKASFAIYLARESTFWDSNMPLIASHSKSTKSTKSLPTAPNSKPPHSSSVSSQPSRSARSLDIASPTAPVENVPSTQDSIPIISSQHQCPPTKPQTPAGIANLGNTCHVNAILQALYSIPEYWGHISTSQSKRHNTVKQFLKLMCRCQISNAPIDTFALLESLQKSIRKLSPDFRWNKQQDAAEVMQHLLCNSGHASTEAYNRLSIKLVTSVSCDTCLTSSLSEVTENILSVPIGSNIQNCIHRYLAPETLVEENQWFCHYCNEKRDATKTLHFADSSDVVILQLMRFASSPGNSHTVKSTSHVGLQQSITLPICERSNVDEVSFNRHYNLRACINHTGTKDKGHYTAYVNNKGKWFKCNDAAVNPSSSLNNLKWESYIVFYVRS